MNNKKTLFFSNILGDVSKDDINVGCNSYNIFIPDDLDIIEL